MESEVRQGLLGFTSQWQEAKLGEGEGHALRPPEDPLLCLFEWARSPQNCWPQEAMWVLS